MVRRKDGQTANPLDCSGALSRRGFAPDVFINFVRSYDLGQSNQRGFQFRLITRGGYNWSDRYPWIVEVALTNRHKQFFIDGEAVLLTFDGISDSTPCIRAGMTSRSNSRPSTSWR